MSRRRVAGAATLAVAGALALAACHSTSGSPVASASSPPSLPVSTPALPSSPPSTSVIPTTPPSRSTAHPSTPRTTPHPSSTAPTTPPSSTAPTSPPTSPVPAGNTCTSDQLSVRAMYGGATPGQELALLIITNTSTSTCSLRGYPDVQLQQHGHDLGKPAVDTRARVRTVTLHAGGTAQVRLTASTTCQAPLSDHVRVRPPGTDRYLTAALELRGCTVHTGPVTRG